MIATKSHYYSAKINELFWETMRYVSKNPSFCQELGAKARERVRKEYNWDRIVDQTEEVYYSLFR